MFHSSGHKWSHLLCKGPIYLYQWLALQTCQLLSVYIVQCSRRFLQQTQGHTKNTANTAEGGWSVLSRSGRLVRATAVGA